MRLSEEAASGAWITTRFGEWGTVAGVATDRFDAYARIYHPVACRPSAVAASESPPSLWTPTSPHFVRWATVARAHGSTVSASTHWEDIATAHAGTPERSSPDFEDPPVGRLNPGVLSVVAEHLGSNVDRLEAAFWTGWTPSNALGDWSVYSHALDDAPGLVTPGRSYALLETNLDELRDTTWTQGFGWTSTTSGISPQLLWPQNHAWLIATEIDWDSTIVGGDAELIEALTSDLRLEAIAVPGKLMLMRDEE